MEALVMNSGIDLHSFPILVVDDEKDNVDAFRFSFRKQFDVRCATSGAEALEELKTLDAAVIISDQRMPNLTGIELLKQAAALRPDAVGIIVTAFSDVDVLIEAVNLRQVYRYITKPWDSREMRAVLLQAVERYYLGRENRRLQEQLRQYAHFLDYQAHAAFDFGAIVGRSAALQAVLARVEQVASTHATILLRGETGTGKEMVARAVHLNSDRGEKPFVAVNCAALPTELLESELFGHERGAFTGAISQRKGRFELADGGTLFLDEVGDLPMEVQVKLLRVVQEREFERLGGTSSIKVDVRLISATNRDLEVLVDQGRFRQDLYYRLNVFPIELPPLRERGEDVIDLAEHFLEKSASRSRREPRRIAPDARAALTAYSWPGNVRELQNVLERATIVSSGETLTAADLDFGPRAHGATRSTSPASAIAAQSSPLRDRLHEEERSAIARAIEGSAGNIAAAARALGINRSTLYFRIKKFGLDHLLPNRLIPEPPSPMGEKVSL
jgi:two-component system, NtrC family, response regulator AtoC